MSLKHISELPVAEIAADTSALFMWITGPMLAIGAHIPIMKAWGYKPSGMAFGWLKLNRRFCADSFTESDIFMGGGFTTRKNLEFVVLGKRGRSVRKSSSVREVIVSPVREHSRKPDQFHQRVEEYSDGPYLELFARESRAGWDTWGNESTKFDVAKDNQ